jgi:hypothetical protein
MGLEKMKQAEGKEKPPQRPASPAPPLPLERYAGTFGNPVYGPITITPEQDKLYMVIGVKKQKVLLQPFDRDIFSFTWPADFTAAAFTIGPDGRAQSLSVDCDGGTKFERLEAKPAP